MKLTLGFLPAQNDDHLYFDALIHHKIDTEGLEFEVFCDVEAAAKKKAISRRAGYYQVELSYLMLPINTSCWIRAALAGFWGWTLFLISEHEMPIARSE